MAVSLEHCRNCQQWLLLMRELKPSCGSIGRSLPTCEQVLVSAHLAWGSLNAMNPRMHQESLWTDLGQPGNQIANINWITEKAKEFQKNTCFCFIDYAKAFDCVDHNKLWKILKEMGIPDPLTCLLRNLYAGQEATVRTVHGTTDWFQVGKGVC